MAQTRAFLSLSGSDHLTFLQGLITQDIEKLHPNTALYACLLTPQGKVVADFFLYPLEGGILLECDGDIAVELEKKLKFYKLRAQVEITNVSEEWHRVTVACDNDLSFPDPRHPNLPKRIVSRQENADSNDTLLLEQSACDELGIPVYGLDFTTEKSFPLDLNLDALNGVDYQKGCFVGQEVTSRMKRKGEVRKRIWRVHSSQEALIVGQSIFSGEMSVGEISSSTGLEGRVKVRLDRLAKANAPIVSEAGSTLTLDEPHYLKDENL